MDKKQHSAQHAEFSILKTSTISMCSADCDLTIISFINNNGKEFSKFFAHCKLH